MSQTVDTSSIQHLLDWSLEHVKLPLMALARQFPEPAAFNARAEEYLATLKTELDVRGAYVSYQLVPGEPSNLLLRVGFPLEFAMNEVLR